MHQCIAWPEHNPLFRQAQHKFGLACQPVWQVLHDSLPRAERRDASVTPSIVIHSHLLDGIATSVCGLPPFLPASDPRLPNARLGMVLSLHHLEDKVFTYRDTQLSRPALSLSKCTTTLPLSLRTLRYNFERTGRTHGVQATGLPPC